MKNLLKVSFFAAAASLFAFAASAQWATDNNNPPNVYNTNTSPNSQGGFVGINMNGSVTTPDLRFTCKAKVKGRRLLRFIQSYKGLI